MSSLSSVCISVDLSNQEAIPFYLYCKMVYRQITRLETFCTSFARIDGHRFFIQVSRHLEFVQKTFLFIIKAIFYVLACIMLSRSIYHKRYFIHPVHTRNNTTFCYESKSCWKGGFCEVANLCRQF